MHMQEVATVELGLCKITARTTKCLREGMWGNSIGNLPSLQEALSLIPRTPPKSAVVGNTSNPSTEGMEVGLLLSYSEFKARMDYVKPCLHI